MKGLKILLLLVGFFPVFTGITTACRKYTIKELEEKLIYSGYLSTLQASYWVVEQGQEIVPYLGILLKDYHKYANDPITAGAYPFNILWSLGQIGGTSSLQVLKMFLEILPEDEIATLAIDAIELRKRKNVQTYGLLLLEEAKVYSEPRMDSKVLTKITFGQTVKKIQAFIENKNEEGPRAGPAVYDYIEVPGLKVKGYIQRRGDDFSPVM